MKWFLSLLVVMLIAVIGLYIYSGIVDKQRNYGSLSKPYDISEKAKEIVATTPFIADLHSDALLWRRDLTEKAEHGQVDFPRMREGNVALQAFTIVTKSPKGQNVEKNTGDSDNITLLHIAQLKPMSIWFSLFNRAVYQCRKFHEYAKKDGATRVIKSSGDLKKFIADRQSNPELIAGFLGVEGAHCLEGDISNVAKLFNEGVRMMGATHFFDNAMGGSAHGISNAGLTDFGKAVIQEMDRLGMIHDIAHASSTMVDDILSITDRPIITSHTGVRAICDTDRNLSDEQIKKIAKSNGLIGVGFFELALCSLEVGDIVRTMQHIKNLVGVEYIALGSDFDGSVVTPFDSSGIGLLVDALLEAEFTEAEIHLILGGNTERFLLTYLPE